MVSLEKICWGTKMNSTTLSAYLEKRIGIRDTRDYEVKYFKNPTKLEMKYISNWARGIITLNGDLFVQSILEVGGTQERDWTQHALIHDDLFEWLEKNNFIRGVTQLWDVYDDDAIKKILLVVRDNNTNNFILGESYRPRIIKKSQKEIKEYEKQVKKKNPHLSFDFSRRRKS